MIFFAKQLNVKLKPPFSINSFKVEVMLLISNSTKKNEPVGKLIFTLTNPPSLSVLDYKVSKILQPITVQIHVNSNSNKNPCKIKIALFKSKLLC